jgi:hypothetical protein
MEDAHAQMACSLDRIHVVEREECGGGPGVRDGGEGDREVQRRVGVVCAEQSALVQQLLWRIQVNQPGRFGNLNNCSKAKLNLCSHNQCIQVNHPGRLLALLVLA